MWVHNLNPVLFSVGSFSVYWYGVAYLIGALICLGWLLFLQKKGALGDLSSDDVWDLLLYIMIGVLVGARAFMFLWQPATYFGDPLEIFRIWNGGMSFHGGLVGIIVAGWTYSRNLARKGKNISFYQIADALSFPSLLALGIGRFANFVNGELVGRAWSGPWCVVFPQHDEACRHPWTLYASIRRVVFSMGLLGISWLYYFRSAGFASGFIFWNFVFWDGLGRFALDFFRVDPLTVGLTLGQWFSLVMVFVGGYFLFFRYSKDWKLLFSCFLGKKA